MLDPKEIVLICVLVLTSVDDLLISVVCDAIASRELLNVELLCVIAL